MTGNGKAIAHAILLGGSLVASGAAVGGIFYWGGALAEGQESHEMLDCHKKACEEIGYIKEGLSKLETVVEERTKAIGDKIEDLEDQQQRNHNELKQLLRQQN